MTPEEIARRFERRHGYDLIDYAQVALPLYRLTVDAVTMAHREIPPIKEFVMRSIAEGLDSSREIAGFLGLDLATIEATVEQLLGERYVVKRDDEGGTTLTDRGRDVLIKARESSPQDEMLVFLYDRLLLKPIRLSAEQLITPANVDPQETIEIRPYPAEGPEIGEIALPEVLQVLEQQAGGRAVFGRDLLRLKRIVRRVRLYRPGVALVYKKVRSSELQMAFIVDDVSHEGLEHAFAERVGPKKMGFVKSISESSASGELRRYLGPALQKLLPSSSDLDEKRIAVSLARLKYRAALGRAERRRDPATPAAAVDTEAVATAAAALAEAEDELRVFPARPAAPFELTELLDQGLDSCERLLIISSRTLDRSAVNASFLKRLEKALRRGVRIVISLVEVVGAETPALELERLRKHYQHLELLSGRPSQFHYFICDDRYAVVTNRPFLSNFGKVRSFHHVVGYLLQRPDLVQAFATRIEPLNGSSEGVSRGRTPRRS